MLRDGWLVNEVDEKRLLFKLHNGSPYQVDVDPSDKESVVLLELKPGYYDDDLNPVSEEDALAPDEDEDDDDLSDLDEER